MSLLKKSNLPDREIAICQRLAEARRRRRYGQRELAKLLKVTRALLSNCECGLSPVRYELADTFCRQLNINQKWLAMGTAEIAPYIELSPEAGLRVPRKCLFSLAYDEYLRQAIEREMGHPEGLVPMDDDTMIAYEEALAEGAAIDGVSPGRARAWLVSKLVRYDLARLPEPWLGELAGALLKVRTDFLATRREWFAKQDDALEGLLGSGGEGGQGAVKKQALLDNGGGVIKVADVPAALSPLALLMNRVRKGVSARGGKTALASSLGVSRQAVDQWLREKNPTSPTAEIALRLLEMFPRIERGGEQKSAGSASNTADAKTRTASHETKHKSGRRSK